MNLLVKKTVDRPDVVHSSIVSNEAAVLSLAVLGVSKEGRSIA